MTDKIEIIARAMNDKDPLTFDALPHLLKLAYLSNARACVKALKANGYIILNEKEHKAILSEAYSGNPNKPLRNKAIIEAINEKTAAMSKVGEIK